MIKLTEKQLKMLFKIEELTKDSLYTQQTKLYKNDIYQSVEPVITYLKDNRLIKKVKNKSKCQIKLTAKGKQYLKYVRDLGI